MVEPDRLGYVTPCLSVPGSAARELIASGELSPALALSYVVWPTAKLADIPGRVNEHPSELRARP
jgi:hypothetical protein